MTTFDWLVVAFVAAAIVGALLPVYETDVTFTERLGIVAEALLGITLILLFVFLVVQTLVVVVR